MSVKKRYTFFITDELDAGLKALKERDGMPEAEAVRRALAAVPQREGRAGCASQTGAVHWERRQDRSSESGGLPTCRNTPEGLNPSTT
jgi:hypothetical protein